MSKRIGGRLIDAGLCSAEMIEQALAHQKITGHRLGDCLVEIGLVSESNLLRFLAAELKTKFVTAEKLSKAKVPQDVLDKIPVRLAEANLVLPLAVDRENKLLSLVMNEPQNTALVKEIQRLTEMDEVFAFVAVRSALVAGIKKFYYGDNTAFEPLATGGASALKADVSGAGRTFNLRGESVDAAPTGGTHVGDSSVRDGTGAKGASSRAPTSLRDALGVVRGTVGENDFIETINILVGLLEMPRKDFRSHSAQVARQSSVIARRLGLQPREVAHVSTAAHLHDLGKRPDRHYTLSALARSAEFKAEAKRYVKSPIKLFETVHLHGGVNAILASLYEAFDGSGVPHGTKGDDIPFGARIIAAVDAFLDFTRNPFNALGRVVSKDEALGLISAEAGSLYDPRVVELLKHLQSGELLRQRIENDGRQVVVADPDEAVRNELIDALNKAGLVSHAVIKLDHVVDALLNGEAEVIAVGMSFGLQDLLALAQFVRARPESAAVPIFVIGEPSDHATREKLETGGITGFVGAPLNADDAAEKLKAAYLEHVEYGSPGRTVRGNFEELSATDLARTLTKGLKTGRLVVRNGPQEGYVQLERGRALFATFAGKTAEAAVQGLLGLPHAEFVWEPEQLLMEVPHLEQDLDSFLSQRPAPNPA